MQLFPHNEMLDSAFQTLTRFKLKNATNNDFS